MQKSQFQALTKFSTKFQTLTLTPSPNKQCKKAFNILGSIPNQLLFPFLFCTIFEGKWLVQFFSPLSVISGRKTQQTNEPHICTENIPVTHSSRFGQTHRNVHRSNNQETWPDSAGENKNLVRKKDDKETESTLAGTADLSVKLVLPQR